MPLSAGQRAAKRAMDLAGSVVGLLLTSWLILLAFAVACIDTRTFGLFVQQRIGRGGRAFRLVKIRTMRPFPGITTTVTTANDPRLTRVGKFLRRTNIDELPQLAHILVGSMSFVGPRPDVPGFADRLQGRDRQILELRPGITGPATLRFRNEEAILARVKDAEKYNDAVIFPEKVRINLEYADNYSLLGDVRIIVRTAIRR